MAVETRPDLRGLYGKTLPEVTPGAFDFRLQLIRPGAHALELDEVVEEFNWVDDGSILSGSMTVRRPDPERAASLPIGVGHRVRCSVRWRGSWYRLWEMRVQSPETDVGQGSLTVPLTDDLALLSRGRRSWSFRKTKQRKRGWYAHEVAREVARREGIPLGHIARGKHRIPRLVKKKASGLDVLRAAYGHEREKSGTKFIIRLRDGKLEVIPLQRNKTLYVFKDQIEDAFIQQRQSARPVTVIRGRGHIGKGAGAKKVKHTEYRRAIVRRFGHVAEEKDYGRVDSVADLRSRVRRDLAKRIRIKRTASLTVPGVPFLRRGDACQWVTREPGWYGSSTQSRDRSFVYLTSVSHSVSSTGYTTSIDVTQEDPYVKDEKRQDREARDAARRRREANQ